MTIFKAYDIRGTYPDQLTKDLAYKIGRAFVAFIGCKNVAIGKDMRESSDEIEEALIEGITDEGADAFCIGLCTSPMLYYAVAEYGKDAGIMITASHNPGEYNGLKMVRAGGVPLSGATGIKDIEKLVIKDDFPEPSLKGSIQQKDDVLRDYIMCTMEKFDLSKIKKTRIAVDYGNGMGAFASKEFFAHAPAELFELYKELDGSFPNHEANPLKEENLKDIKALIKDKKAELGIAFDGDADRLFFLDEKAEVISCDKIVALVAKHLLKDNPGKPILYDLRSSKVVPETIEAAGGTPIISRVGHSFIKEKMRETGAIFGGELSGHFYVLENNTFESPFWMILKILEIMKLENKTLSELMLPFDRYYATGEINSKVKDKDKVLKEIEKRYSDAKSILHLDGLTIGFDDWWANIRPSNTEPLLRLNLEADTDKLMQEKRDELLAIIRKQ